MTVPGAPRWVDFGWWAMPNGTRRLLSWRAPSGELALLANTRWEDDEVLAVIDGEDDVRRRLDGWVDHAAHPDGLAWLTRQLEGVRR